jgi:hypothetical protein
MRNRLLLVLAFALLGACARVTVFGHTVKDEAGPAAPAAASASAGAPVSRPGLSPITRLAVEFTPAAQQQVAADERFRADALRDAIAAELRSRQLLDLQATGAGKAAVIEVEEFAIRATSNVVLFGHLPSSGVLGAVIRIREAAGGEAREFRVRTDIPLSIAQSGADKQPLKSLYSGFARQLADELTGATPAPPPRR